jgi:hypothetical protein
MGRPPPDPDHVVRAYELWCEGRNLREVQEILGEAPPRGIGRRPGSHVTVRTWIKQGELITAWLREDKNDEHHTSPAMVRARFVHFLDSLMARGFDELQKTKAEYKDIAPILLRIGTEQARALGVYAPLRIHNEGNGSPLAPELPPGMEQLVEAFRRREEQLLTGDES